jgi:hypothetical protein
MKLLFPVKFNNNSNNNNNNNNNSSSSNTNHNFNQRGWHIQTIGDDYRSIVLFALDIINTEPVNFKNVPFSR